MKMRRFLRPVGSKRQSLAQTTPGPSYQEGKKKSCIVFGGTGFFVYLCSKYYGTI